MNQGETHSASMADIIRHVLRALASATSRTRQEREASKLLATLAADLGTDEEAWRRAITGAVEEVATGYRKVPYNPDVIGIARSGILLAADASATDQAAPARQRAHIVAIEHLARYIAAPPQPLTRAAADRMARWATGRRVGGKAVITKPPGRSPK